MITIQVLNTAFRERIILILKIGNAPGSCHITIFIHSPDDEPSEADTALDADSDVGRLSSQTLCVQVNTGVGVNE